MAKHSDLMHELNEMSIRIKIHQKDISGEICSTAGENYRSPKKTSKSNTRRDHFATGKMPR